MNHPVLGLDIARLLCALDRKHHRRQIVGVNKLLPPLVRSIERARVQAVHHLELGRPAVLALAGADVPIECHRPGSLLRKVQHFLPRAQLLLRLP